MKRDTRHFAKRQLTWFRRERDVIWLSKPAFSYEEEEILAYMIHILKEKGILTEENGRHGNERNSGRSII